MTRRLYHIDDCGEARGTHIIGGLTAHTLPMTRDESAEIFIYDLAVRADRQRRGVGRLLINTLRADATAAGIGVVFVAACRRR